MRLVVILEGRFTVNIDFKYLEMLNIIADSGVPLTEQEILYLMEPAKKSRCRVCQEKVKMIAINSGLEIFYE